MNQLSLFDAPVVKPKKKKEQWKHCWYRQNEAKDKLLKKFEYAKYGILTLCTRMQENPDERSHLETIKKILLEINHPHQ